MGQSENTLGDGAHTVRRATIADVRAIVALLRDDRLGSARESSDWARYEAAFHDIDNDPNQFLAVVEDSERTIVGTMQLTRIPGLSRNATKRLQIEAVRIASSARGTGLGTEMIEWAHEYGRAHGAELAQLTSDRSRADAISFYEALGYTASHVGFKLTLGKTDAAGSSPE